MNKPQIKNVVQNDNKVELRLSFPGDAAYFDGHFPGFPILPGVAQVHWAMKLAEEYFKIKPQIRELNAIKFSQIIKPDMDVGLALEYVPEKKKVSYAYSNGDKKFSSGIFKLIN